MFLKSIPYLAAVWGHSGIMLPHSLHIASLSKVINMYKQFRFKSQFKACANSWLAFGNLCGQTYSVYHITVGSLFFTILGKLFALHTMCILQKGDTHK